MPVRCPLGGYAGGSGYVRTVRCPLGGYGLRYAGQRTVTRENFRARTFKHILVLEYRYRVTPRNGVPSVE